MKPGNRSHQTEFYNLSSKVRDRESRNLKASKIVYVLNAFSTLPLDSMICLDVGCSSGMITTEISPLYKQMIGLEYDRVSLNNVNRDSKEQVGFLQGDAMTLPFQNNSIDAVICAQVYEHVPDDNILFEEIYRVLKPGGEVFFSGPNKLFPIEPHYYLPFLHWLPSRWADRYLQLMRRGDLYYERSRTIWGLRKVLGKFEITDVSLHVMRREIKTNPHRRNFVRLVLFLPPFIWKVLLPFIPNFNWLLRKPQNS